MAAKGAIAAHLIVYSRSKARSKAAIYTVHHSPHRHTLTPPPKVPRRQPRLRVQPLRRPLVRHHALRQHHDAIGRGQHRLHRPVHDQDGDARVPRQPDHAPDLVVLSAS